MRPPPAYKNARPERGETTSGCAVGAQDAAGCNVRGGSGAAGTLGLGAMQGDREGSGRIWLDRETGGGGPGKGARWGWGAGERGNPAVRGPQRGEREARQPQGGMTRGRRKNKNKKTHPKPKPHTSTRAP